MERIQKIIAATGLCSRRQAEEWIERGRVSVNGEKATLGTKASMVDKILVDGKPLSPPAGEEFWILHKPRNVIVTRRDPEGRTTIYDLPSVQTHHRLSLLPVGRLDFDSEGLLLLTSRRDLIHRLTHPRFEVPRTYEVKVKGVISKETLDRIGQGIPLKEGPTNRTKVRLMKINPHNCWVEITLKEGKNREVRRIFEGVGHPVLRLKRVAFGPFHLGDLAVGATRAPTAAERQTLEKMEKFLDKKPSTTD
ncbi:MAG: rRNA pseudouridine synthase [Deltaproteobacteria bacterium]|nr:rRNA pseudouridine synthase [Deltaproteobacteria bacterium]